MLQHPAYKSVGPQLCVFVLDCSASQWRVHWARYRTVQFQLSLDHAQLLHHVQVHCAGLPAGLCLHLGH